MKFGKLVDKAWEDKTAAEILKAPPSALEGLTEKHDEALAALGIKSVGDMAKWKYFQRASALLALAEVGGGKPETDSLDEGSFYTDDLDDLYRGDPDIERLFARLADERLPLSIYTSGTQEDGRKIRDALLGVLANFDLEAVDFGLEELGSWRQSLALRFKKTMSNPEVQRRLEEVEVALENAGLNKLQSEIDRNKAESVSALATALKDQEKVVITLGGIVFLKIGNTTIARSIDAVTASKIEKSQQLLDNPQAVLELLARQAQEPPPLPQAVEPEIRSIER